MPREKSSETIDLSFSLGLIATKEGDVRDVIPGSPAYAAGLGPGNETDRGEWPQVVERRGPRGPPRVSPQSAPAGLLGENGEYYSIYEVNYHEGER